MGDPKRRRSFDDQFLDLMGDEEDAPKVSFQTQLNSLMRDDDAPENAHKSPISTVHATVSESQSEAPQLADRRGETRTAPSAAPPPTASQDSADPGVGYPAWVRALASMGVGRYRPEGLSDEQALEASVNTPEAHAASRNLESYGQHPLRGAARLAADIATPFVPGGHTGGVAARALAAAGQAGVQSALGEFAANPDADAASVANRGAWGAGIGGAASGALAAGSGVAKYLGDKFKNVADKVRVKSSWGVPEAEIESLRQRASADQRAHEIANNLPRRPGQSVDGAIAALAERGEKLVPPNKLVGRPASDWQQRFEQQRINQGEAIGDVFDEALQAGAQLPPDPRGVVSSNLRREGMNALNRGYDADASPELLAKARQVAQAQQTATPQAIQDAKIGFDSNAFKGQPGTPESYKGQANLAAANQYRGMLKDYVQQGGSDLPARFDAANRDFGTAAILDKSSAAAAHQAADASGGIWSKAIGGGIGGAVLGAGGYLAGGPAGAALGASTGAAIGSAARGAAATRGPDTMANMFRGMQGVAQGAAGVADAGAKAAPWISALAQRGASMSDAEQPPRQPTLSGSTPTLENARGQNMGSNVQAILRTNPAALGQYSQEFAGAGDDVERLGAIAERLARSDDDFKRNMYPRLVGAAVGRSR